MAVFTATVPQSLACAAQADGPVTEVFEGLVYVTDVAGVSPLLPSLQLRVAGVGEVVGEVPVQAVIVKVGGVGGTVTTRFTGDTAAVPAGVGVAVSDPEYVPAAVPLVTRTAPQLADEAAQVVGPLRLVPAGDA